MKIRKCWIYGYSEETHLVLMEVECCFLLSYFALQIWSINIFPICSRPIEVERCILGDLRNRVQLSSVTLPSISFYTLINSQDGYTFLEERFSFGFTLIHTETIVNFRQFHCVEQVELCINIS